MDEDDEVVQAIGDVVCASDEGAVVQSMAPDGAPTQMLVPGDIACIVVHILRLIRMCLLRVRKQVRAKPKVTRRATAYNEFISRYLSRIAVTDPNLSKPERFTRACAAYREQKLRAQEDRRVGSFKQRHENMRA